MMKKALFVALLTAVVALPALAVDTAGTPQKPMPNFEERKSGILQHIDQRITRNQEEKACVQAAANQEALKACREKFKADLKEDRPRPRK